MNKKSKDISFEQLILKLRVEEDNRMNEKEDATWLEPNVNMVSSNSSMTKFQKGKAAGYAESQAIEQRITSIGETTVDLEEEASTVEGPWVDTGATKHICNSKNLCATYQKVNDEEPMYMRNATTTKVEGRGKVNLKLTSGNELVLTNVLHVPAITNNLISGPTLRNKGFKIVFESDKVVITKGGVYVGKGYLNEEIFKLSTVPNDIVNTVNSNKTAGSSSAFVYMLDSSSLCHSRLGHDSVKLTVVEYQQLFFCLSRPMKIWNRIYYVSDEEGEFDDHAGGYGGFLDVGE
ncbi:hypothetical protein L6452_09282 [Arctium lappa]|uniref:Uncharacterized protein n=1 Tax=Arctium lappa TaxID=4217 RepID=A0ACB9DK14_ARCLA|nr:hypothetical protein L6452_09282 [Arctium lappa]